MHKSINQPTTPRFNTGPDRRAYPDEDGKIKREILALKERRKLLAAFEAGRQSIKVFGDDYNRNRNFTEFLNEMQELQKVEQTKAQAKESKAQVQMRASSYELMRDENFPKKGMNTSNPNWRRWRN